MPVRSTRAGYRHVASLGWLRRSLHPYGPHCNEGIPVARPHSDAQEHDMSCPGHPPVHHKEACAGEHDQQCFCTTNGNSPNLDRVFFLGGESTISGHTPVSDRAPRDPSDLHFLGHHSLQHTHCGTASAATLRADGRIAWGYGEVWAHTAKPHTYTPSHTAAHGGTHQNMM